MDPFHNDETTYISLLPPDIHRSVREIMIRAFVHRAIITLYAYYMNSGTYDTEYMVREVKSVFSTHSIPIDIEFIGKGCSFEVNLTLPDHIEIPSQAIIDLIMLSRRENCSKAYNPTSQFNLLLKEYNIPYRIVEYDARAHNGGIWTDMSVIRIYPP